MTATVLLGVLGDCVKNESVNYGPQPNLAPVPVFINKVLLQHSPAAPVFICHLYLALCPVAELNVATETVWPTKP